jgi:hypothetical protein
MRNCPCFLARESCLRLACFTWVFPGSQAVAARLEALENDHQGEDPFAADSGDDEFVLRDDSDGGLCGLCKMVN